MQLPGDDLQHVLARTGGLWSALERCDVFLTGGTGFFGRWLVETYLAAHDAFGLRGRLVVLSRDPARLSASAPQLAAHPALVLLEGAQHDFRAPTGDFGLVIHAAVEYGAPDVVLRSNLLGSERVLSFAAERRVRDVLLLSSGAVYGKQPADLMAVPESYAGAPDVSRIDSAYGEMKRASELMGLAYAQSGGFAFKAARGFAFVGPHLSLDAGSAIGNFMRDALANTPIRILGDGTTVRSYLYAADLAIWLWTIALRGAPGRAYNVGSDVDVALADVARRVARHLSPEPPVTIAQLPVAGRPSDRYVPDVQRARSELGLDVWIDLDGGIERTLRWHRQRRGDRADS